MRHRRADKYLTVAQQENCTLRCSRALEFQPQGARTLLLLGASLLWLRRAKIPFIGLAPFDALALCALMGLVAAIAVRGRRPWDRQAPMSVRLIIIGSAWIIVAAALSSPQVVDISLLNRFIFKHFALLSFVGVVWHTTMGERYISGVVSVLGTAMAIVAISGLAELHGIWSFPQMAPQSGRIRAGLEHSNQLGIVTSTFLPLLLAHLALRPSDVRRWGLMLGGVGTLVAAGSKFNLFLAGALVPATLALMLMRSRHRIRSGSLPLGVILLMVAIWAAPAGWAVLMAAQPNVAGDLSMIVADPLNAPTLGTRMLLWEAALNLSREHLWFGIGPDHTGLYLWTSHAHNVFLEYRLTIGWFGLFGLMVLLAGLLLLGRDALRAAMVPEVARSTALYLIGGGVGILGYIIANQSSDSFGSGSFPALIVAVALVLTSIKSIKGTLTATGRGMHY